MHVSHGQAATLQTGHGPPGTISLQYGHPDPSAFPLAELRAATDSTLQRHTPAALDYGPTQGPPQLLDTLAQRLYRQEGLRLGPDRFLVTSGASQGLNLICRLWARPGDVVLVEAPSLSLIHI